MAGSRPVAFRSLQLWRVGLHPRFRSIKRLKLNSVWTVRIGKAPPAWHRVHSIGLQLELEEEVEHKHKLDGECQQVWSSTSLHICDNPPSSGKHTGCYECGWKIVFNIFELDCCIRVVAHGVREALLCLDPCSPGFCTTRYGNWHCFFDFSRIAIGRIGCWC
jgi:hypothetical protein